MVLRDRAGVHFIVNDSRFSLDRTWDDETEEDNVVVLDEETVRDSMLALMSRLVPDAEVSYEERL